MLHKEFRDGRCIVEFTLPETITAVEGRVFLIGDFNAWDRAATPMTLDRHLYRARLELAINREYQYLYVVDGETYNDWHADKYVPNPYRGDNSIVITSPID